MAGNSGPDLSDGNPAEADTVRRWLGGLRAERLDVAADETNNASTMTNCTLPDVVRAGLTSNCIDGGRGARTALRYHHELTSRASRSQRFARSAERDSWHWVVPPNSPLSRTPSSRAVQQTMQSALAAHVAVSVRTVRARPTSGAFRRHGCGGG